MATREEPPVLPFHDGGSLEISISRNNVIVSDTAIGIPEDDLPRILSGFTA